MTVRTKRPRLAERAPYATSDVTRVGSGGTLPAIGLEAEFTTIVDGEPQKPEDVFGSPRHVVRGPLVHRTGRSYHLPTGGALYFDTGVMEIATPMIEIARGCGARGTRSLWESLGLLRSELDAWEIRTGRTVKLAGFSAHYNVSFELSASERANGRSVEQFAYLLTHVLAAPVMLLATNRRSSGIGVRPRGNRIEVTVDFTPDAALTAATATLIVGIVREVMTWPSYDLAQLDVHGLPTFRGLVPAPHSSRQGWSAKVDCFSTNPFLADVDARQWDVRTGGRLSLREMAGRTTRYFWRAITALGDPLSLRLISAVMRGRAPSLLELDDRPDAYDDVGRLCTWDDLFPIARLSRSRYERVLGNAIAGRRVRLAGAWHRPVGIRGWTHVVFRREHDGVQRVRSLDDMLMHLDAWDRSGERRITSRRVASATSRDVDRRGDERRAEPIDALERRRQSEATTAQVPPMLKNDPSPEVLAAGAVGSDAKTGLVKARRAKSSAAKSLADKPTAAVKPTASGKKAAAGKKTAVRKSAALQETAKKSTAKKPTVTAKPHLTNKPAAKAHTRKPPRAGQPNLNPSVERDSMAGERTAAMPRPESSSPAGDALPSAASDSRSNRHTTEDSGEHRA